MIRILLCSAVLLSGCATSIVQYKDSTPVPVEDRGPAYEKYANKFDGAGTIIVVRDSGMLGSAGESDFFINGELIAEIHTKESVTLYMRPDDYLLGIGPGVSASIEETKKYMEEQALRVEPGKTYYYRISVVMHKGLILQRTSLIN